MIGKSARQTDQLLASMERQLDRIYTALVVRDPGTAMSAEAYEGLRKSVVVSTTARRQQVAQLAEMDVALRRGATAEDLTILVTQWLGQAGVERIEDPDRPEVWEGTVPSSNAVEVAVPAYVDLQTGGIVRQGRLRERVEKASTSPRVDTSANHSDSDPKVADSNTHSTAEKAPDGQQSATAPQVAGSSVRSTSSEEI